MATESEKQCCGNNCCSTVTETKTKAFIPLKDLVSPATVNNDTNLPERKQNDQQ